MNKKSFSSVSISPDDDMINHLIIDAIQDIKGKNILKLDLRSLKEAPASYFIICEGDSSTQIKAIANNVNKRLRAEIGLHPNHTEGVDAAKWVLVDYFDTIVHVFYPETRSFYDIEELWGDAAVTQYENL